MDIRVFRSLIGYKISILMDGLRGKESYVGEVQEVVGTSIFMYINLRGTNPVEGIWIESKAIISMWVYENDKRTDLPYFMNLSRMINN